MKQYSGGCVAVDTGGTFTDFVYQDAAGRLVTFKVDSVPSAPDRAILGGFGEKGIAPASGLRHGTTVATNALLEGKTQAVALLITRGFRDVLQIGRQTRRELYNLAPPPRRVLVPPELIFEVDERTLADGTIQQPVREDDLETIRRELNRRRIECLAVCFLHSYRNSANEQRAADFFRRKGFVRVCASSEVVNEYREYERFSTTAINALLLPLMGEYLERLESSFGGERVQIMQSNGGIISGVDAARLPVKTILSGPAGGVVATDALIRNPERRQLISFDMGGTSTDVSLIDGEIHFGQHTEIAGHPVLMAVIDIHTVGAGGGSIARFDEGGILRVGPESVGANPGPAFYGLGDQLSVSDANLLSGRLQPDFFNRPVHADRAARLLAGLASAHGLKEEELLLGLLRVVNSNMERAIKKISVERGHDLRDFSLVSFGGAGGLHAASLARALEMKEVIVPHLAGVFSALGILGSNLVADFSRSVLWREPDLARLKDGLAELALGHLGHFREVHRTIAAEVGVWRSLDVRYLGQSYEINVPYGPKWKREFHRRHDRLYGSSDPARPLEVVNLRVKLIAPGPSVRLPEWPAREDEARPERFERVLWDEGVRRTAVFHHDDLRPGQAVAVPAVILGRLATTVVPPGFGVTVDRNLNLVIRR